MDGEGTRAEETADLYIDTGLDTRGGNLLSLLVIRELVILYRTKITGLLRNCLRNGQTYFPAILYLNHIQIYFLASLYKMRLLQSI